MTYKRKTRDEYLIQQYTGPVYGWITVCVESTLREAMAQRRVYSENQPEYPVRWIKKQVKIEQEAESG